MKWLPIGLIGTLSIGEIMKRVSNRAYWNPFHRRNREKGIQLGLLEPVPLEKSVKGCPTGLVGTRSAREIVKKVSNWAYWNPFHWRNR
ncbi:hypothetical protein [Neobacillus soli]|uniref:hypothetical protein n=1 Tax=Neobacillus soli TaxID=220688 RepID=UPI001155B428|nr:hypothetical protein [Neobacillus soli]